MGIQYIGPQFGLECPKSGPRIEGLNFEEGPVKILEGVHRVPVHTFFMILIAQPYTSGINKFD